MKYIPHCPYCKTYNFKQFDNGKGLIWESCENNCMGSIIIYQYGKDDYEIKVYKRTHKYLIDKTKNECKEVKK